MSAEPFKPVIKSCRPSNGDQFLFFEVACDNIMCDDGLPHLAKSVYTTHHFPHLDESRLQFLEVAGTENVGEAKVLLQ